MTRNELFESHPPHMIEYWIDDKGADADTLKTYCQPWIDNDRFFNQLYDDIVFNETSIKVIGDHGELYYGVREYQIALYEENSRLWMTLRCYIRSLEDANR